MLFTVFLGAVFAYSDNDSNFYGQASRNLLLIIVSVYGWVRWAQHRRSGAGNRPAVSPRWTTTKEKMILIPAVVLFFLVAMQIFKALGQSGNWLLVEIFGIESCCIPTSLPQAFQINDFQVIWSKQFLHIARVYISIYDLLLEKVQVE